MSPEPGGQPSPERELEDLLRRAAPERPDPLRRARARRAFLGEEERAAGGSRAASAPRMAGEGTMDAATDDADFEAWLAGKERAPLPGEELRRRCRARFLSAASAAGPRRYPRAVQGLVLALAAAAMLAVTFLLPEPERWRVRLDGPVRFAGLEYGPGDEGELSVQLESSGTLESLAAPARLALGEELELELRAGSTLTLPVLPELDGGSPVELELAQGETYVRTAASYPGNPIRIRTPIADVHVSGTALGVLVDERGTCVCVAEGRVSVTGDRLAGLGREVGERSTLFVLADRTARPETVPFPAPEAHDAHTGDLLDFLREP